MRNKWYEDWEAEGSYHARPYVVRYNSIRNYTIQREALAGENIGKYGKLFVIRQTKTIQVSTFN